MAQETVKKFKLKTRYKISSIVFLLLIILLLWSRYISTSGLTVKEYKVVNSNLPTNFHGLKIIHFSDIHYGRTVKKKELINIVNKINTIRPDIVFFTGDLVDRDIKLTSESKKIIIESLNRITTTYGKYAINGNHDLILKDYKDIIEKSGFNNISNSFDVIYNRFYESILIGGLESDVAGEPNPTSVEAYLNTNNDKPMYKIMLMHTPDTFNDIEKDNFDLILAGHSHNGQVRLPFIGKITTPAKAKQYYDSYYKIGKTNFFISGGLGTSVVNFRLFNKPSFNLYRLTEK